MCQATPIQSYRAVWTTPSYVFMELEESSWHLGNVPMQPPYINEQGMLQIRVIVIEFDSFFSKKLNIFKGIKQIPIFQNQNLGP